MVRSKFTWLLAAVGWMFATANAQLGREGNATLTLPAEPPRTGFRTEVAFPGLSFTDPVALAVPPFETNRLFIAEQAGLISVITNLTRPNRSIFLDLSARLVTGGERGLLGLAFHPGHATNGQFYVFYTLHTTTAAGTGLHDRLSRFRTLPGNPNLADPASEQPLLTQFDEASNHNGGDLHFGPDGYLYVSLGDEGSGNDTFQNSQRIDKDFFSGLLRIDVDQREGSLLPNLHAANTNAQGQVFYAIPQDNPFVGASRFNNLPVDPARVRTEFWAVGLRNPWRFSFDSDTGLLYLADVGQDRLEEVNIITKGGNYGWNYREATRSGPATAPAGLSLLDPFLQYSHGSATNQGNSITGGVVYRGSRLAQLYGYYVFADYVSGNIWGTLYAGTSNPPFFRLTGNPGIAALGIDPRNGDILLADQSSDTIKRLNYSGTPTGQPLPPTLGETGAFADLASLRPAPGIVPYDINVPFWSDGAIKRRWFGVPQLSDTLGFSPTDPWASPSGTVWIKHFDLELTNGVPSSARRLETRFLVRSDSGIYGITYRWAPEGRDASLVPEEGMDEAIQVWTAGSVRTQVWHYPSRSECLACHNAAAGWSLGFNAAQLNRDRTDGAVTTNQIMALAQAGYFGSTKPDPTRLPRAVPATDASVPVTARVRSYLAANCSPCHQPGGSAIGLFDARFTTPIPLAGLIGGMLNDPGSSAGSRVVVPGSTSLSQIYERVAKSGPGQMPPLARNLLDEQALALLRHWITNTLAGYETPTLNYANWELSHFASAGNPAGTAQADPDQDGWPNRLEYLFGTDPLDPVSKGGMRAVLDGDGVRFELTRRPNYGIALSIETSSSVDGPWELWTTDVNPRVFGRGEGTVSLGPVRPEQGRRFYRLLTVDQNLDATD